MAYIINKSDGPRREDVAARKLIDDNRLTINRIANHLSAGRWGQIRQERAAKMEAQQAERALAAAARRPGQRAPARPYIRISANGRVVVVDEETGRQMLFLGDLRRVPEGERLCLATAANGFCEPLPDEDLARLAGLDGALVPDEDAYEPLKQELARRLGIAGVETEAAAD